MRFLAHVFSLFVVLLMPLAVPAQAEQPRPFVHQGIARDAARYETYLKANWKAEGRKPADLKAAGDRALARDPRAASRSYAAAVTADDTDSDAWLGLARSLLAIKPDANSGSERYDLPVNASGAAYLAYHRAKEPARQARALGVLGDALARRSYWRPAIDALKLSLDLADNSQVRESYEKLKAEHGFRLVDYKADTEASSPRVCLQFSENIQRGQSDLAKYVTVDGKDPSGVSAEGQQLCVEGLTLGQRYQIRVRAGLPSDVGEPLAKQVEIATYMPDRKPFVRFTGRNYVLPSKGQQGIPVVTVNTTKVAVEIYRIGDRNLAASIQNGDLSRQLSAYDTAQIREQSGVEVFKGELDVPTKLNEEVTTALPVSEAVGELKPGAYVMIAKAADRIEQEYGQLATQWFIVSDLGLTAFSGSDGVHAFVRSLSDTRAVPDTSVKLVARNNEVLGTARTDAKGYVRFDAGLARGEGGLRPALLVAENGSGEYAFLDLTAAAFDLSDRGVSGRDAPGPVDGFVYTERGVYRPGEEVNISGLLRDSAGKSVNLPATVIVTRPDGVEHRRFTLNDQGLGGRTVKLALGSGVMTGTWRVGLYSDPKAPSIAQAAFLVEDFVPERLDMTLEPAVTALVPEETQIIKASGRFLYGPPAAGLALEGEIVVKPSTKDVPGFSGYRFGIADEVVNAVRKPIETNAITDAEGKADVAVTLPAIPQTARPLEADVILRLREGGGRTIERSVNLPVDTRQPRIGIRPLFDNDTVREGETAAFEVVSLDGDSKRVAGTNLRWDLVRLETRWQWYRRDGSWAYEAVTLKRKIASGDLTSLADAPSRIDAKVDYGRFQLEVASTEPNGPASSVLFSAGWYTASEAADSPEMLDVALDKPVYEPGDTAKLRIASKEGGRALIAVLGSGLHLMKEVEIPKGGGDVEIAVDESWGAGAYATALLYRPMDEAAKRMPNRAIGVKWIALDQKSRELKVAFDTSAKIKSGETLSVPVKVSGLFAGEEAYVTVAAVDVGVLNLTRYQPPAPEAWFNAQRKLGTEIRDFYGRLIDGMRAERGKLRSGGDGGIAGMNMQAAPPVEETVSRFSGIVRVSGDGTAKIDFDIPDFNGTVRLMAVAWSEGKVGHGTSDVIVRDAVALTASAPRFLTLGDEARLDLDIHNVEGPAASYRIDVAKLPQDASSGGPASVFQRSVDLAAGERKRQDFNFKPADIGEVTLAVNITGPNGIDVKRQLTFDVKPPAGDIKRTTVSRLAANGGKITVTKDLVHDLIASRTRINLSVGPAASLDVPGLLATLDRYPHGCAEQTVSRALPLVYANAVAAQLGIGADKELKERVQKAVDRVFEMQDASGAFGIWGPSNTDLWLTSYVTDFLTRARESGYVVKARAFDQALDRLGNFIANAQDFEKGGEEHAYALYVLARNGRAPIGELRYYVDTRLDRFSTPLAKAQLGAALAMMGDKPRAETAFKAALASLDSEKDAGAYRSDYGSTLRDGAALVTLASESGIAREEAPRLVNVISKAYLSRNYTSTQEQAWMLLAANALGDEARTAKLSIDGAPVAAPLLRALSPAEMTDNGLVVRNDGDAAIDAVVSVIGAALTPEPPVSKGFTIERSTYALDGTKVDLKSATGGASEVKQNDRFVMVVKVEAKEEGGRVILVDRLPAGFEIENPHLVESGDIKGLDWLKTSAKPEHTEFRDDRFVAAFNFSGSNTRENGNAGASDDAGTATANGSVTATVAYIVRAVTPGTFIHPAATVEDMYRPERYARSATGKLNVTARE
jgi:uncharacterized protein YfaS (alpha-2-macroglobulin family)